ncbi:hypothetical protein Metev_1460 [Methanohalobium evestigatum Z-7303]|uniref:LTD domain-containing protein n=1 Tax=Methanohalobium evestigatum (strain ATCC BAA-1072 / DSM 3721 / NBRC 107634 / OCM 161 / Z-7303) TaxID=644295 RepID=D7E9P1_METEZ|nr:lamin tail domain-containing protein [Methanohalobium evestigatum]ADI74313.1 hypothetical protein Metev_1460 [Methanohalobium evestigatum Z-7303]
MLGDKTAASPVVGIVIMFILTVTMAATVVTIAFGFAEPLPKNPFFESGNPGIRESGNPGIRESGNPGIYINEFKLGADNNPNKEWVSIKNSKKSAVNLKNWIIKDYEQIYNYSYKLNSFNLGTGETVTVHTGKGTNTSSDIYLGLDKCIWNNTGDKVYLYNSNGNLVDTQKEH